MSRQLAYMCGVPDKECSGKVVKGTKTMRGVKAHSNHEQAYKCMSKHLKSKGYSEGLNREFHIGSKDNQTEEFTNPTVMLTKKSRFGGVLRQGKEKRYMPEKGDGSVY